MASSFLGLNTSKLGVMTHQTKLSTVGHNIANAETSGYSRQIVTSVTTPSIDLYGSSGKYWLGTGVNISSVSRARDFLTDRQLWKQNATYSYYGNLNSVQSNMETIFTEPSDTNFQAMLDAFWTSVQNVASNPGDVGTRTTMRQAAVDLVNIIQTTTKQLGDQVTDINDNIRKSVDRINQINAEILNLNKQIVRSEAGGGMANDLRDARDLLVDELSQYARVQVNEDEQGNYVINFDGQVVVDGISTTKLEVYENKQLDIYKYYGYQTLDVRIASTPPLGLNFTDGSLAGLLEARDSDRQGILSKLNMLNDISKALLCDFNQIHKEGLGLDNSTGLNFFGQQGIQYAELDPTVTINPITGLPVPSSAGFDPVATGTNNSEKNWIHYLQVNDVFFDPLNGLDKIAAKTLAGNLEVVLSTVNRVKSIANTIGAGGINQAEMVFVGDTSNIIFKGQSQTEIKIDGLTFNGDGTVATARYEMYVNGVALPGGPYDAVISTDSGGTSVLTLKGDFPFEHFIQVSLPLRDLSLTPPNLNPGDEYTLTLFPTTGGSASLTNTPYTRYDSTNQTAFTLVTEDINTNTGEITKLKLSLDGVTEYAGGYGTFNQGRNNDNTGNIFLVWGTLPDGSAFAFEIEMKDDIGNTAMDTTTPGLTNDERLATGDKYQFKMPPSEAASDNAVRMAQFMKYGVTDESIGQHSMYMGDSRYKAALGKKSVDEEYNEGLSALGVQTQTSYNMWLNQLTLVEQISTTRANYKDVSLDEELTNMIMFQKGYNSNARMLTAMDEMLDKLINGTGRVGL